MSPSEAKLPPSTDALRIALERENSLFFWLQHAEKLRALQMEYSKIGGSFNAIPYSHYYAPCNNLPNHHPGVEKSARNFPTSQKKIKDEFDDPCDGEKDCKSVNEMSSTTDDVTTSSEEIEDDTEDIDLRDRSSATESSYSDFPLDLSVRKTSANILPQRTHIFGPDHHAFAHPSRNLNSKFNSCSRVDLDLQVSPSHVQQQKFSSLYLQRWLKGSGNDDAAAKTAKRPVGTPPYAQYKQEKYVCGYCGNALHLLL